MDAILLVGGKGTRLKQLVSDRPKPLALVQEIPFLDILLSFLADQHLFTNVILAAGYMGEQIASQYRTHSYPFALSCIIEPEPLGTGGAIEHCLPHVESETFFVCNGDSYIAADLHPLATFHENHSGIGTLLTREVEDTSRYGTIETDSNGAITRFIEKGKEGRGHINAGIYFFRKAPFLQMNFPKKFSIEEEGFPKMIHHGLYSFSSNGSFIDIGTAESYSTAQQFFTEIIQ